MSRNFHEGVLVGASMISIREREGRWEVVYDGKPRLFFETKDQALHRAKKLAEVLTPADCCPVCARPVGKINRGNRWGVRFAPHVADPSRPRSVQGSCPGSGMQVTPAGGE